MHNEQIILIFHVNVANRIKIIKKQQQNKIYQLVQKLLDVKNGTKHCIINDNLLRSSRVNCGVIKRCQYAST